MGMPVCANLVRAGHDVTAWDRDATREDAAAASGVQWGEAALAAPVVVTVLPNAEEVRDVLERALPGLGPGAAWIDMSTCAPGAGRELAGRAEAAGVHWLEAPMGGGVEAAGSGSLQLLVGGDADVLDTHRELLSAVAGEIRHMGGHGAGYASKLLINLLWFGQAVAGAEALLIARREGLDLATLRAAIDASPAANHFIRDDLEAPLHGDYVRSFRIDRCVEELESITALASELGLPHELADVVEAIHRRALERYGAVDGELLAVALLEEQAGLKLGTHGS
jgi:3-hydroxyisobutyrate dehydrogenase-like beta-hydroxyacid dehydrogenase